jgi:hypothetical protein
VLFLGDSHMQQYWARVEKLLAEHAAPVRTIVFKTLAGCAPVPGIERRSLKCSEFVEQGLATAMRPEVETVVIAGSWEGFLSAATTTGSATSRRGRSSFSRRRPIG